MRKLLPISIALLLSSIAPLPSAAQEFSSKAMRFHDQASDTAKITRMLTEVDAMRLDDPGENIAAFAQMMIGLPYVAHTLEGQPEQLTINVDEVDCTTLVHNVLAMSLCIDEKRTSWQDFAYNLQRIRYRGGRLDGYPSRLHYTADWAVDNVHRGILKNATYDFPRYSYITRTLDFMSENADKYAALADSATLAQVKQVEIGYRGYRFPYIKTIDLGHKDTKEAFRNGDIVAFVTKVKNLDFAHMGIIIMKDGTPYVLHASQSAGKVVLTEKPLTDFMKRNRDFPGLSVFRLVK